MVPRGPYATLWRVRGEGHLKCFGWSGGTDWGGGGGGHTESAEKLEDQLSSMIVTSMKELKGSACSRDAAPPRPASSNVPSIVGTILSFLASRRNHYWRPGMMSRASWSFYVVVLYRSMMHLGLVNLKLVTVTILPAPLLSSYLVSGIKD